MSIIYEKRVIERMIRLYCLRCEGNDNLCSECAELLEYACRRLDKCPYGDGKHPCKKCPANCYTPEMRQKICRVMRFSGPRMLLRYPLDALKHLLH